MKWIPGIIIATATVPVAALGAGSFEEHHASTDAAWAAGMSSPATVLDTARHGSRELLTLRGRRGELQQVAVPAGAHVSTRDGRALRPTSILAGDTLALRAGGRVEDTSQVETDLHGVVAHLPAVQGDPMVILVQPSRGVLVDLESAQGVQSSSPPPPYLSGIEEADLVQVRGVLDETLGEMTQTDSVVRRGP